MFSTDSPALKGVGFLFNFKPGLLNVNDTLYQIKKYSFLLFIAFFCFLMVRITFPYLNFRYDIGFLLTKQAILYKTIWRYSFYIHITSSIFVLLFGGIQFTNIARPPIHRIFGKYYVAIVLFSAAPSGLVLGFYANGGIGAQVAFMIAAILWWIVTFLALKYIRNGEVMKHRQMMYCSYALTLSAISLRTYALTFPMFFHLHAKEMYVLIAWLGWVPNLLIGILLAKKTRLTNVPVRLQ